MGAGQVFGGQVLIGASMIAFTVVIHTVGIIGFIAFLKFTNFQALGHRNYVGLMRLLVFVILGIFLLHALEIWSWAFLYLWLEQFESMERALYFSTVTFTTLGYGDITLGERWQLLSSFEAANGIILFGVSTAFVFAVMRKLFEAASIVRPEN
jgi:hypothetical protein